MYSTCNNPANLNADAPSSIHGHLRLVCVLKVVTVDFKKEAANNRARPWRELGIGANLDICTTCINSSQRLESCWTCLVPCSRLAPKPKPLPLAFFYSPPRILQDHGSFDHLSNFGHRLIASIPPIAIFDLKEINRFAL